MMNPQPYDIPVAEVPAFSRYDPNSTVTATPTMNQKDDDDEDQPRLQSAYRASITTEPLTGDQMIHQQASKTTILGYNNRTHMFLRFLLISLSLLFSACALAMGIPGWAILGRNKLKVVDNLTGKNLMNSKDHLALFAIGVILEGVLIIASVLSIFSSVLAMKHERTSEAETDNSRRRLLKVGMFTVLVILFLIALYFLAFVIVAAKRGSRWHFLISDASACPPDMDNTCKKIDRGFNLVQASSILGLLSLITLLMINTSSLSHTGSRKTRTM